MFTAVIVVGGVLAIIAVSAVGAARRERPNEYMPVVVAKPAPVAPMPAPPVLPVDQIAVAPESGLVIRKRPSTTSPPLMGRARISYATTRAALSGVGITAHREDGIARIVKWESVVGIVARRLPAAAPFDGATFIDVVSTSGATLRILPSTELSGLPVPGDGAERARSLVQLLAVQCLDASLDAATKAFTTGAGAAQIPDERTLAAHDAKLA